MAKRALDYLASLSAPMFEGMIIIVIKHVLANEYAGKCPPLFLLESTFSIGLSTTY